MTRTTLAIPAAFGAGAILFRLGASVAGQTNVVGSTKIRAGVNTAGSPRVLAAGVRGGWGGVRARGAATVASGGGSQLTRGDAAHQAGWASSGVGSAARACTHARLATSSVPTNVAANPIVPRAIPRSIALYPISTKNGRSKA